MSTTHPSLDSFEDSLLDELRGVVRHRREQRSRRRLRAAAVATATLVAGAGVAISLPSDPAFAVQGGAGGDVVVTISRLSDAAGLERALAEHGVTARVSYHADLNGPVLDPGKMPAGAPGPVAPVACSDANVPAVVFAQSSVRITIPAATVATGEELSIFTAGPSPTSASVLVAFGDRDSGCAAFDGAHGWIRWTR